MLKVVIVGCGQLGSRHLQSLAQLEEMAEIYLVDPSERSIEVAKERFYSVLPGDAQERIAVYERNLSELDSNVDVAIMASGSKERAKLTRELIENTEPKYIIFEKFLFQEFDDYDDIGGLLSTAQVKAWVNQWFSSTYAFRRIASWLNCGKPVSIEVTGDEWGLACNSAHFVELFDYLNKRVDLTVVSSKLDDVMLESKREGYFETTGKIILRCENGALLEMTSQQQSSDGLIHIKMESDDKKVIAILDAYNLNCECIDKHGSEYRKYIVPMQSKMTNIVVQRLTLTGECQLPEYSRSAYHHKLLVNVFDSHFRQNCGWKGVGCPIT